MKRMGFPQKSDGDGVDFQFDVINQILCGFRSRSDLDLERFWFALKDVVSQPLITLKSGDNCT